MTRWILIAAVIVGLGGALATTRPTSGGDGADTAMATEAIARGRYLVRIGGCNDCHTPDYMAKAGDVPEEKWLIGTSLGYNGPWGTTYAANLRRVVRAMDEDEWVSFARSLRTRPPMPWFNLQAMAEADLRAIHGYIRSLPADDNTVPDFVPPDREPATPYLVFTPQPPKR